MFHGSYTALVTPFKRDKVDLQALEKLITQQLLHGTHGIVVCGSTGEGFLLSYEEKAIIIESCVNLVKKKIPVIVNLSALKKSDFKSLAHQAENLGADGLMISPPPYLKLTQESLIELYEFIHECTQLPIIIYNIPSRSGVTLSQQTLIRLSCFDRIICLKDGTGDLSRILELAQKVKANFTQMSCDDELNVGFLAQGGHGWISAAANVVPELYTKLYTSWIHQDLTTFMTIRDLLAPLSKALFIETNPMGIKYALSHLNLCFNELRSPFKIVSKETENSIIQALKHATVLS